ncbi:MAG: glycosyltransferase [Nitrospiria bacterium]
MKLCVVIPVLNQFEITEQCLKFLCQKDPCPYDIIVIDNGSDKTFTTGLKDITVIRYDEPIGNYSVFKEALEYTDADIIAFFHSDFFVFEKDWSERVISEFERDSKLGLMGFVWSTEIDNAGGRGLGTASNFIDKEVSDGKRNWHTSGAEPHGRRITGFEYAAVLDGCSMIFRRAALMEIEKKENMTPFHFYDKLMSNQVLELGWKVGGLGIGCGHCSGQTVNAEDKVEQYFKKWALEHHVNPGGIGTDWRNVIYLEAERQWLSEYRDRKHFIPLKVDKNGNIKR